MTSSLGAYLQLLVRALLTMMGNWSPARVPERARWFNPKLRNKNYDYFGDAYDDSKYDALASKWNKDTGSGQEYLTFVKQASKAQWIHLRLLADFMQIGRMPRDWKDDLSIPPRENIKIRVLEYFEDERQPQAVHSIDSSDGKPGGEAHSLTDQFEAKRTKDAAFRLYVVEDLSTAVIELLGSELKIEPDFFRAHIVDYAWYNIRDRWRDNQPLELFRRQRDWWQIRYVTARYFEDEKGFEEAAREAKETFNILRRPDNDKSRGWWDIPGDASAGHRGTSAAVALTRSRATFWLKPDVPEKETAIGTVLTWTSLDEISLMLTLICRSAASRPDRLQRLSALAWPRKLPPSSSAAVRPESAHRVA